MHARHHNRNGVRPNSLGMEGSIRVQGMYNTDYRNFNRSFGRGSPKPFPPPQPPRKTDIFMEAGRLAAEYLVSQGLLPPNVLPEKLENGGLNNQVSDLQEFVSQDRENLQLSSEGRTPALARLGNVTPDAGFGRRRFPDEFNAAGSKNNGRGRRRGGPFRCNSSDWGRENGNAGSLLEKTKSFSDIEGTDDIGSASNEEQQQDGMDVSEGGVSEVISKEFPYKSENAGGSESKLENFELLNNNGSKASSSNIKKAVPSKIEGELAKGSDDSKVLNLAVVKDIMSENETDKEGKAGEDDSVKCPIVGEGEEISKSGSSLLRLCTFAKVPTRARSSLPYKGSEVDPVPTADEENKFDIPQQKGPKVFSEENFVQGSSSDTLSNYTHSSKCIESDISKAQSVETNADMDAASAVDQKEKCLIEQSFPVDSFMFEDELGQGPPGIGNSSSPVKERGEKRAIKDDVKREGTKKFKEEWPSSTDMDADEDFHNPTFGAMPSNSHGQRVSHDEEEIKPIVQGKLMEAGAGSNLKEEKQIFSNSFKICDLNLMEANDTTENHDNNPILVLPSTSESKSEVPVDVDLSTNNNKNRSAAYNRHLINGKEIIIVDLDDDSIDENKAFDASDRKTEGVYSGLESLQNNTGSTREVPDVHDGYGRMISELLGTDITSCSSVSTDITSLQTDIGLHNEAGMLCDDDPIYLSLGEIPISFPGVWPEKPFG